MKKDSFPKRTVWESNFFRMGWIIFPFSAKRKLLPLISRSLKKKIVTAKSSNNMSSRVCLFLKSNVKTCSSPVNEDARVCTCQPIVSVKGHVVLWPVVYYF